MASTDLVPVNPQKKKRSGPNRRQRMERVRPTMLAAFRAGATNEDASALAGINPRSFYNWMSDPDLSDFADAVHKAKASTRLRATKSILDAIDRGDWKAAAWFLTHSSARSDWADKPVGSAPTVVELADKLAAAMTVYDD